MEIKKKSWKVVLAQLNGWHDMGRRGNKTREAEIPPADTAAWTAAK